MKRNQNFDHNHSQKVLSCRTTWTPIGWKPGSGMALPLPLTASLLRANTAIPLHSEQNWTGYYIISLWSTPSLCWVVKSSITYHLAVTMAD